MQLNIDTSMPMDDLPDYLDLMARADAACRTLQEAEATGIEFDDVNDEDYLVAATIVSSYARDPEGTSRSVTDHRMAGLTPAAVLLTRDLLRDFGTVVVAQASQIRTVVVNKLLVETTNADPRIRLRALELLGKMQDVSLFVERKEVTHTAKSQDEIKAELEQRVRNLRQMTLTKSADGTYTMDAAEAVARGEEALREVE